MKYKFTSLLAFIMAILFMGQTVTAQFSLSAEIRPRTEYRYGFKTPFQESDDAAFFTEQRSRLNFQYSDSSLVFRLSLQDVRIWGENNQIFKQENGNTFLSESWVQYQFLPKWKVKIGRQIISYDNQRYLGGLEWAQQGRRHDALLIQNHSNKYKLDIGLAFNADDDIAEPGYLQSPTASFYSKNNYKSMQYAYFHKSLTPLKFSILAMNLGFQAGEGNVSYRQTFGTYGKTNGALALGWDFYYQTGESGVRKVNALLAGLNLTYQTSATPLTIGVEYISGKDADSESNDIESFTPDFGTNHAHNGYMDYYFVGPFNGTVGVTDLYLKTKFKINKGKLSAHLHHFLTGSKQFDANNEELDPSMGTELDLVYAIPLRPSVNLHVGYSFLMATETMETLRDKDGQFNYWGWMMLTVKPELWRSKKN